MENLRIINQLFKISWAKNIALKPFKFMMVFALGIFLFPPALTAQNFSPPVKVLNDFTLKKGWKINTHFRTLADVDGNGIADIVGFGDSKVLVALGDSSGKFGKVKGLSDQFTKAKKWKTDKHFRCVGDVNGDGSADIVGFHDDGVYVQLYDRSTKRFGKYTPTVKDLGTNQGWTVDNHPRYLADVNGDGKSDIVGFGNASVFAAIGDGRGNFAKLKEWTKEFTKAKGWNKTKPRMILDLNGDGKADLLGINENGVYVAYSNGNGFSPKKLATTDFANSRSWDVEKNTRTVADFNNDGTGDLVGFGDDGIFIALGQQNGTFAPVQRNSFNDFTAKQGWKNQKHFRTAVDINGDGYAELVGFGNTHVLMAKNKAGGTSTSTSPSPNPTPPSNLVGELSDFASKISNHISGSANLSNQKFGVKNLTLRLLLNELGKHSTDIKSLIGKIPSVILDDLVLESCTASISPVGKKAQLNMKASFKNLSVNLAAAITPVSKGKGMAIMFGAESLTLTQIATLISKAANIQELKEVQNYLKFSSGFMVSTSDKDENIGLEIFKNQKLSEGVTLRGEAEIQFPKIIEKFKLNTEQTKLLKQIFGETTLYMQATVPPNPTRTYLEAGVATNIGVPSPFNPKVNILSFDGMRMGIRLDPVNTKLKAGGTMSLYLHGQNANDITQLQFKGDMVMEPGDASIGLEMSFEGINKNKGSGWKKPFGIPGIEVKKLAIGGSLEANIPWVNGAVSGDIVLGLDGVKESKKIRGKMALGLDVNSPQSSFLDISINSLSIAALLDAFPVVDIPADSEFRKGLEDVFSKTLEPGLSAKINAGTKKVLETGLKNTKIYVAPTSVAFANEVYEQGISLKTNANLFGWKAEYDLELNPDPLNFKFKVEGKMDPIKMKIPKTNITVLEVNGKNQKKPIFLMKAEKSEFPKANISGQISFLKIAKNKALAEAGGKIVFNKDIMKIDTEVSLFEGDFTGKMILTADKYTNLNEAKFITDISIINKGKVRDELIAEIKQNMKNADKYVKMLREASSPNKPILETYKNIYNEYKKVEDEISKSAIYILEEGLNIQEVKLNSNFNSQSTSLNVLVRATIGGQVFNENINLKVSTLDQQKFIENIANEILNSFKKEGAKLFNGLENELDNVNKEVYNALKAIGIVSDGKKSYKVAIDYIHDAIDNEGTNNTITVKFYGKNGNYLGEKSHAGIQYAIGPTWVDFEIRAAEDVETFKISTNGTDAFYIDQIRTYRDGELRAQKGANNGKGWVVSTDRNDAAAWKKANAFDGLAVNNESFNFVNSNYNKEYKVVIDFFHDDVGDRGSVNTVTVNFLDSRKKSVGKKSIKDLYHHFGGTGVIDFVINAKSEVKYLEFSIDGNDEFFIDFFRLYINNKKQNISGSGRDKGKGWLLSTDPNDVNLPKMKNRVVDDKAYRKFLFKL